MYNDDQHPWGQAGFPKIFVTTVWTAVQRAGKGDQRAKAMVYQMYVYPIYWFQRRKQCSRADAEDLVQRLFENLFAEDSRFSATSMSVADLADVSAFAVKLSSPTDQLSRFLSSQFTEALRARLADFVSRGVGAELLQETVVEELNQIIAKGPIYSDQRFADVRLAPATSQLLARQPQGRDLIMLNLLLLGDAYQLGISRNQLSELGPEKGRLRTWLLACAEHLRLDELKKMRRQKRGGGQPIISWDAVEAEKRYQLEPAETYTPEDHFNRAWAKAVMQSALDTLKEELASVNKRDRFETLKGFLTGEGALGSYAEAAARLGVSEQAVKGTMQRWRNRLRGLVQEEIRRTVRSESEVDDEIRHLYQILSR